MGSGAMPAEPNGAGGDGRFAVAERQLPGGVVLTLVGELDHDSAPELREVLERLLEDGHDGGRLLLDCSRLDFCDSSGLNVLLKARLAAGGKGSRMALVAVGAQVARVFEITGATSVFPMYSSLDEALGGGAP